MERDIHIAESFLRAEGIQGQVSPSDSPDIDCQLDDRLIGIELTELVPHEGHTRIPNLNRLLTKCVEIHIERRLPEVRVFVNFDPDAQFKKIHVDRLADQLVDRIGPSVKTVHDEKKPISLTDLEIEGIFGVTVHLPIDGNEGIIYPLVYVVDIEAMAIVDIKNCIRRKEKKLEHYRTGLDEYWLVIHFGHLPSEKWFIGPTPNLFEHFPVSSNFSRVYLYTPGLEQGTWLISGDTGEATENLVEPTQ